METSNIELIFAFVILAWCGTNKMEIIIMTIILTNKIFIAHWSCYIRVQLYKSMTVLKQE